MENYQNQNKGVIEIPLIKNLLLFLVGWLGLSIFATIISLIITSIIDVNNASESYTITLNCIVNFGAYLLLFVTLFIIMGKELIKRVFKDYAKIKKILKGLMFGVIVLGAQLIYNLIIQTLFPNITSNNNQSNVVAMIHSQPIMMFISVVILAPICEEVTYRLGLFGAIYKKNRILAHILAALFFGLLHSIFLSSDVFTASGEEMLNELLNLPSYIIPGLIFSIAYENENSLATSITAHMVNNVVSYISVMTTAQILLLR